MTRTHTPQLSTRSIDTASFIYAATGNDCSIVFSGNGMASFTFDSNSETRDALIGFETGMMVEGRRLLDARNILYKRIKGGR